MRIRSYKDKMNPEEKHREHCFTHCQKRIWERYKDTIYRQDYDKLCKDVRGVLNKKPSQRSSKHFVFYKKDRFESFVLVKFKKKYFWVVFDKKMGLILTFMDPSFIIKYIPKLSNSILGMLSFRGVLNIPTRVSLVKQKTNKLLV